jgi:hypothetical protein
VLLFGFHGGNITVPIAMEQLSKFIKDVPVGTALSAL